MNYENVTVDVAVTLFTLWSILKVLDRMEPVDNEKAVRYGWFLGRVLAYETVPVS
jgi:hypothetical protein